MKRVLCCLVVLTGIAAAQAPDPAVKDQPPSNPVVVLASEEVKAPPRLEHVRHAFQRVAAELSVVGKELPHVVVFYVSRAGADTQHLPKNTSIAVEAGVNPSKPLYHLWIIDDVRDTATVEGLVMVMNDNFALKLPPEKIRNARDHVVRNLNSTVDYHTLAEGK